LIGIHLLCDTGIGRKYFTYVIVLMQRNIYFCSCGWYNRKL